MGIEQRIERLIEGVRTGRVSRRGFVRTMVGLGLTAPMAGMLLAHQGVAMAQPVVPHYKPTRRGGGGTLRLLWWQGPTLVPKHLFEAY